MFNILFPLYKAMNIIDSCNLLFILLKILHVLTIIKAFRVVIKTVKYAIQQVLTYIFIILPILIAYALIGMGIYGPYTETYHTFQGSLIAGLGLIVGQADLNTMMRYDPFWTVIYVFSLTLLIIFLIISSFSAIFIDTFEYTVYKEGYPGEDEESIWTIKDAFAWMLDSLPNKWLISLEIKKKASDDQNDQSEINGS